MQYMILGGRHGLPLKILSCTKTVLAAAAASPAGHCLLSP